MRRVLVCGVVFFLLGFGSGFPLFLAPGVGSAAPHAHGTCRCGCAADEHADCDGGCCGAAAVTGQVGICSFTCRCYSHPPQLIPLTLKWILPRTIPLVNIPRDGRWLGDIFIPGPLAVPDSPDHPPENLSSSFTSWHFEIV